MYWFVVVSSEVMLEDDKVSALKALDFARVQDEMGYKAIEWPDKPE